MPLTRLQVEHAKPQPKPYKLFDGRGLYLEVSPIGGRGWRFKYRFAGKEKRISLGVYPDVGLKDARDKLDEVRKQLTANIDPSEQRKAQKLALVEKVENTFEAIAREWFVLHCGGVTSLPPLDRSHIYSRIARILWRKKVLGSWGIEMLVSEEDDQKKALTDFLHELVS